MSSPLTPRSHGGVGERGLDCHEVQNCKAVGRKMADNRNKDEKALRDSAFLSGEDTFEHPCVDPWEIILRGRGPAGKFSSAESDWHGAARKEDRDVFDGLDQYGGGARAPRSSTVQAFGYALDMEPSKVHMMDVVPGNVCERGQRVPGNAARGTAGMEPRKVLHMGSVKHRHSSSGVVSQALPPGSAENQRGSAAPLPEGRAVERAKGQPWSQGRAAPCCFEHGGEPLDFLAVLKNIPSRILEEEVMSAIESMGFPRSSWRFNMPVRYPHGNKTRPLNRGYAFVRFSGLEDCERFVAAAAGFKFSGRNSDRALSARLSWESRQALPPSCSAQVWQV